MELAQDLIENVTPIWETPLVNVMTDLMGKIDGRYSINYANENAMCNF
jgi:hypothetical protein